MVDLLLWQKIVLYALLLISIYIFVKTSQIKINNAPLIKLKYRILLALFFPIILGLAFIFGFILRSLILVVVFLGFLIPFSRRKKLVIRRL